MAERLKNRSRAQCEHLGDLVIRAVHNQRGPMVLGTMGLENVFSEGLLLEIIKMTAETVSIYEERHRTTLHKATMP
jgi:hypothetical protein